MVHTIGTDPTPPDVAPEVEDPRPSPGSEESEQLDERFSEPDRMRGYGTVMAVYATVAGGAGWLASRRGVEPDTPLRQWSDVALVGLAGHKLARILTKETITRPIRAPFTEVRSHGGPNELNERPRHRHGMGRSIGELLSCPFCAGVWISTGLTLGLALAPAPTRLASRTLAAVAVSDFLQFGYVAAEHASAD